MTKNKRMLKVSVSLLVLFAFACDSAPPPAPSLQQSQQPVVYGEDDRQDVYAHPDEALRDLTRQSIVSRVRLSRIDRSDPEGFTFGDRLLGESLNLCEGERFADQVRAGGCSGTLIGPRTVMTAGHCIDADRCHDYAFVFDRFYRAEGELETVTAEDVYPCRRLLAWADDDDADFAVVELDRRVTPDRVAVPVSAIEPLPVDTPLTMIGFPNGIPAKIDTGGRVVDSGEAPWRRLDATVDAFGGNSGSGIFNADRHLVAILEGGRTDYIDAEDAECRLVNDLPDDVDDAENLVYVGRAMEALCIAEPFHFLCEPAFDGGSWCDACDEAADCRAGWTCDGTCRAPCADDAACRSDHRCVDEVCTPHTRPECRGDTLWTVPACAPAVVERDCLPENICEEDACRVPSPGDRCAQAIEIAAEAGAFAGQTVDGIYNSYEGECGGDAPEVVYTFAVDEPTRLIASATGFDTLLYVRQDCDADAEIACNDDRARGEVGALLRADLEAGTYHLFVDGYRDGGEYALEVDFRPPCEPGCELGDRQCTDAGVIRCERGPDDCPQWTEPTPCDAAARCMAGVCIAPGDSCENPIELAAEDTVIAGVLSEHSPTATGTCGGAGPERIYQFDLERPTRLQAEMRGEAPRLYVRTDCASEQPELACAVGGEEPSRIDVELPAGRSYLIVDSEAADAGAFTLTLDFESECVECADAGLGDAGPADAGPADAGLVDAAAEDSSVVDAAPVDMGRPDAGAVDAMASPDMMLLRDAQAPDGSIAPAEDAAVADAEADGSVPPDAAVRSGGDGCATASSATTSSGTSGWALLLLLLARCRWRSRLVWGRRSASEAHG